MSAKITGVERTSNKLLENPGDYSFQSHKNAICGLNFHCPGCNKLGYLPFDGSFRWNFDGNVTSPTLTPSVWNQYCCGWHGYLTAGVWTPL
jgi:hypothetical protein